MNKTNRTIWEHPWGYEEGFYVAIGIALSGFLLQISIGNLQLAEFQYPVNLIFGLLFIGVLLLLHFFAKKSAIVRWLSSVHATVPAIVVLLSIVIILGIVPQFVAHASPHDIPHNLSGLFGWYQMTTSWTFIFISYFTLAILGFTILKRTRRKFTWQDIGFYLNHVGLFLAFFGGMLGSADVSRLRMNVTEGSVEWRAADERENIVELPIAIQLDTFMIEEYPPKLMIVDLETGKVLPENRPVSYVFEGENKSTKLMGYNIDILSYLPNAAIMRDSLNSFAVPYHSEGATHAIKIRVSSEEMKDPVVGWVSNGSFMFPYSVVYIDKETAVAMPVQEVKKYSSHVQVFTDKGDAKEAVIEVNKPLTIDSWRIYQLSYDQSRGKYSRTSVFELVRDPWLPIVYAGIIMLLAGSFYLFIVGPKKKKS
ncbi:MAG: cytochrome c biogenesis protein ResB [Dysgonamonadaceae bacterium]|nr:cytochrome c biogenesis protein ResB [Dysgonamonadaceae bacterium]